MRNMESKVQLRKEIKKIRDCIPGEERKEYSRQIVQSILKQSWYENTDKILVYSAIQSEVDLSEFIVRAWESGKQLYFPKVFQDEMEFFCIRDIHQLRSGAFHVMEPDVEHQTLESYVSTEACVPVLVPGVVFSRKGERIGYGKGYYDRFLSRHHELMPIGICFERQLVNSIAVEDTDIIMQQIVTELSVYES